MSATRPSNRAWILALALLAAACSSGADGAATRDEPAATTPATETSTPAADHHDGPDERDDHDGHEDHDDQDPTADHADGEPPARPQTTEETLAAIAAMDPDRLAGAHDHHDDEGHDEVSEVVHPNGIDPERIVIPAIDVDADVIDLGLRDDGAMQTPTDFAQAGWFTPGPRPGRVGPAVIAGHVDSRSGPAVFHELTDLRVGDVIEVHGEDGEVVTFAVRESEQVPKDAFPTERVYAGTPGPELRLITCGGIFDRSIGHYDDNIIVYADRTDV